MKFGTYYFLQATPGRSAEAIIGDEVEQMVLSERLGFDSVWLTEHHYADYGISSAPSVLLATVAARTERVKLGMAVWVLPFHNPLRLAEETATLDILSRRATDRRAGAREPAARVPGARRQPGREPDPDGGGRRRPAAWPGPRSGSPSRGSTGSSTRSPSTRSR